MDSQNQVVLAIGSNQGNRLEVIQSAIECIHNEVGTIVKVSRLYETPAWGFESEPFYNCALVMHSPLSADVILDKVLSLEKKLGRVRSENEGYQSRIIDIKSLSKIQGNLWQHARISFGIVCCIYGQFIRSYSNLIIILYGILYSFIQCKCMLSPRRNYPRNPKNNNTINSHSG